MMNVDDPLLIAQVQSGEPVLPIPMTYPVDPDLLDLLLVDDRRYRVGPPPAKSFSDDGTAAPVERVGLVLYVSANSIACVKAVASLRSVAARFPADRITLEVRDVAQHVEAAARDRVLFTPTLLCSTGLPTVRVLGDMSNEGVLIDLLRTAGLKDL